MGTRALTVFLKDDKPLCVLDSNYDGYPSGYGNELAYFLRLSKVVNGYSSISKRDQTGGHTFNGIGCLAAMAISYFKTQTGYFYMTSVDDLDEKYIYYVYEKDGRPHMKLAINSEIVFDGLPDKYNGHKFE